MENNNQNLELVNNLIELLTLEEIDIDLYRGPITKEPWKRVFGGQVVGQALMAACKTVDTKRMPHSLHAYFMRPGDPTKPIIFEVKRDRDGGTFTSRRVVAKQSGMPILNMACSFQIQENGLSHQLDIPNLPPPDNLISRADFIKQNLHKYPEKMWPNLLAPRAVEFRQIFNENPESLAQNYWFKINAPLPEDQTLHRVLLAYATDYTLLGACLAPHQKNWFDDDIQVASLDHAVWFHEDIKFDDWLLYTQDSPWAGGGRGLNRGMIYDQSGKLVASVAQEALIRMRKPK